jgi:hypothetical protein
MLYVAVILGIIGVIASISLIGYIALKLFRSSVEIAQTFTDAHNSTLATLERVHNRNMKQLQEMADRFMSLDFTLFKNYQLAEAAEEGGFEEPEEEMRVERYTGGGGVVPIGAEITRRLEAAANERQLLAEDFPEGWDEREGNR